MFVESWSRARVRAGPQTDMLIPIEAAGTKRCFIVDNTMYCSWVTRKTVDGLMAMISDHGKYIRFPIKWKPKKEEGPPNTDEERKSHYPTNEKTPGLRN